MEHECAFKRMRIWNVTLCFINILLFALLCSPHHVSAYDTDNMFVPGAFPGKPAAQTFSIPLERGSIIGVYPAGAESHIQRLSVGLKSKCGVDIPFYPADDVKRGDLRGKHLIVIGNISNNRWALELYKRRYAFADAFFPGKGGVIVHPAASIWDAAKFAVVVGYSDDGDIGAACDAFLSLLDDGAKTIGTVHYLKTPHSLPKPPDSVESVFDAVRKDIETTRVNYGLAPNWGLYYFLTGDRKWAEHFRDGMYFLYERAEKTGRWIPEPWTNMYFLFWKMALVWDLLDEDPFFTDKDRAIFDEVLWGYFTFCRGEPIPILDEGRCLPGEIRQNHSTFMALSLFYAHRYFTGKYGLGGLDDAVEKYTRCFDGQALSYRPNDDAGGYLNYGVTHLLNYLAATGDDSYLESGKMKDAASLTIATIDNRGDPVSFGDRGGYGHRAKNAARVYEDRFLSMAAWYYNDGQIQWVHDWRAGESRFSLELLYSGDYISNVPAEAPDIYLGIQTVFLDDASLRWCSRRTDRHSWLPAAGVRYIDKMVFRRGFDPEDEYMLIDGISFLAHGHLDGNTVARLTWNDRIWLVDADYIKLTPQYHNGIVVARNGVQEEPPPLTVLEYAADMGDFVFTRTLSEDFNGADWERSIIWKKGRYFLFLDRIEALKESDFRLESRWRTLGDVSLAGNILESRQGDAAFFVKSADTAEKRIVRQDEVSVCLGRKRLTMNTGDAWTFSNLLYAADDTVQDVITVQSAGEGVFVISEATEQHDVVGTNPEVLSSMGIESDCALYVLDSKGLSMFGTEFLGYGGMVIETNRGVHITLDSRKPTGRLVVPDGSAVRARCRNIGIEGIPSAADREQSLTLDPGKYRLTFAGPPLDTGTAVDIAVGVSRIIEPETVRPPKNFGIEVKNSFCVDSTITAVCGDGASVLCGTASGEIVRFSEGKESGRFRLPSGESVRALCLDDVDGDGIHEIFAGDDGENLYCFGADGKERWRYRMSRYFGPDASANDIVSEVIDNTGEKTILVATNGWKLYAFRPDGTVKWESFVYYHPLTKVRVFENGGKKGIAVGTTYSTPLNIVDPADGVVNWFTWEQVGDEYLSATDYCGIHLTDMIFTDTDLDGSKEIVLGTKYNRIYALNAFDGRTKWIANVGDEVTRLAGIDSQSAGEQRILAATDAGDLIRLDRAGDRTGAVSFDSAITDIEVLADTAGKRSDIALATVDGRIVVCDEDLRTRASLTLSGERFIDIVPAGRSNEGIVLYCVSENTVYVVIYRPYLHDGSRFH